jgi:hypothetical protein
MAFAYDSAKFKGQCLEIRHIAKLQDVISKHSAT